MPDSKTLPFEQYLQDLEFMLVGLPEQVRAEIKQELYAHLEDAALEENVSTQDEALQQRVITSLGSSLDLGAALHEVHSRGLLRKKRIFDVCLASCWLLILAPFFLLAAIIIKLESPGPVFYRSQWVGRYGRHFTFYRLRSMTGEGPDLKVTRFGAWMRRVTFDEMTILFNVLKGDLSMSGPRMLRPHEVDRQDPLCRRILLVPPGACSPSMARFGMQRIEIQQQLKIDADYIEQHSLRYDLQLIWQSTQAIIRKYKK